MKNILKVTNLIILMMLTIIFSSVDAKEGLNPYFNLKVSMALLDSYQNKSSIESTKSAQLKRDIIRLEELEGKSEACISHYTSKLKSIDTIYNDKTVSLSDKYIDQAYIKKKQSLYRNFLSECRYIAFLSGEILYQKKEQLHQQTKIALLHRTPTLWSLIKAGTNGLNIKIDTSKLIQLSGFSQLSRMATVFYLLCILGAIYLSIRLRIWLYLYQKKRIEKKKKLSIKDAFLHTLRTFCVILIPVVTSTLYLLFFTNSLETSTSFLLVSYILLLYVVALITMHLLFTHIHVGFNPLKVPRHVHTSLYKRLVCLVSIIALFYLVSAIFREQALSILFVDIMRLTFVIIISSCIFWCIWPLFRLSCHENKNLLSALLMAILILLLATQIIECMGYHALVIYLIRSLVLTGGLSASAWLIFNFIGGGLNSFCCKKSRFSSRFHRSLGVRPHQSLSEVVLFRIVSYSLLFSVYVIFLLRIWRFPEAYIDKLESSLLSGFDFYGVQITPSRMLLALVAFSVVHLLARYISNSIAKQHQFENEKDSQVAIASIMGYVGFTVALVISMVIAGFNFTGLAIIVGALSVGIGMGLQNIVNNFISGLILLMEKPIKPGDRIIVGDTEGFVKKIRIRSTQIKTLAKEDVIVPNSDMVTLQVTNYMFRDRHWRVTCQVGVAYGSDTSLVKDVLYKVAIGHPDVVKDLENLPTVLFRTFGDSSLNFELWCIINDVNLKYRIISDLNFAIDQAFREHGIVIAFPQRDLHIKSES